MVKLGEFTLFIDLPPHLLLTPMTISKLSSVANIEAVLIDPGVPVKQSSLHDRLRSSMRFINKALHVAGELNAGRVVIIVPDVWSYEGNIKLFNRFYESFMRRHDSFSYIIYVHDYLNHADEYRQLIMNHSNLTPGFTAYTNTLDLRRPLHCNASNMNVRACVARALTMLSEFSKLHIGGVGLRFINALCAVTPLFSGEKHEVTMDTLNHHRRYRHELQPMIPWSLNSLQEYWEAFRRRIKCR